jgi:hypothetical protein
MSKQVKKTVTSTSYSMTKFYRRISTAKPSTLILSIIAIAFSIFLFGGGLYDIIMKPLAAIYYQGKFLFIYPQLSEQFVADSVISMMLYALGIIGLITMYQSTKYAYKPRQATMMMIIGLVLLWLAYIILEAIIQIKLSGG